MPGDGSSPSSAFCRMVSAPEMCDRSTLMEAGDVGIEPGGFGGGRDFEVLVCGGGEHGERETHSKVFLPTEIHVWRRVVLPALGREKGKRVHRAWDPKRAGGCRGIAPAYEHYLAIRLQLLLLLLIKAHSLPPLMMGPEVTV